MEQSLDRFLSRSNSMPWLDLRGHDEVVAKFRRALEQGRLASTFLFLGPEGVGKRAFATRLARALLCQRRDAALLDPCNQCPGCAQVMAGTHPDLVLVSRPTGKNVIPLGLLKGDEPDYPVHSSLLFQLALKPMEGGRKVAIIDDADYLNQEGANCLLKTLEEPPPRSVLILIGTSADRQLPTIRSRAQIVRFGALDASIVSELLVEQGIVSDASQASRLAAYSGGSLTRAKELADPQLWTFRSNLFAGLAQYPLLSVALAQTVLKFVDEAGKEAPLRRARLRVLIGFAVDFYRQLFRQLSGMPSEAQAGDGDLSAAIRRAADEGQWDAESAADAAERSTEALAQIDRNANLNLLVEAWFDELASRQPAATTSSS
jgi:DNA polymerase-3 subunit delta'